MATRLLVKVRGNGKAFAKAAEIVKSAYVIGDRAGEQATVLARIAG